MFTVADDMPAVIIAVKLSSFNIRALVIGTAVIMPTVASGARFAVLRKESKYATASASKSAGTCRFIIVRARR